MSTDIEWCDETWNPSVGCSRVSPGCDNCYAIRVAAREMQAAHRGLTRRPTPGWDEAIKGQQSIDWTGEVRLLADRLDVPLRWRKPRRVFVDSMSDLFHQDVPSEFVGEVFARMGLAQQHTFQVLTKRPQRMRAWCGTLPFPKHWFEARDARAIQPDIQRAFDREQISSALLWPIPNVWLGTSVEDQRYADMRIPHLIATPAAVRFLSIEPLLGPVDLRDEWLVGEVDDRQRWQSGGIDWVIVGGESGPGARPVHPQWVRDIRDQCVAAGVPFFFKQWGAWAPTDGAGFSSARHGYAFGNPIGYVHRIGKKAAGRELDGRTWEQMPA